MPRRVLVTGAAGFVGANLARRLVNDGHEVHLLLRPGTDDWRLAGIAEHARVHEVDLLDEARLGPAVREARPEWVFHLAAHGAYSHQSDGERILRTNVLGTANLLGCCLETGFDAFVNTGTSSEYGTKDHGPGEAESLEPTSDYAVSKASATLYCRFVARKHEVHLPTLRLYSVYGPFEEPSRLIPRLIVRGLGGAFPPLASPGLAHDFVYTDDVVEACLHAATEQTGEPGAVYNVGTGRQITLGEAVELARDVLEIDTEPQWNTMSDRDWDSHVWIANIEKIESELNWSPRVGFEKGFRRFVGWFRENPELLERYRSC